MTGSLLPAAELALSLQIEEVERELGLRRRLYPQWVAAKRMTPEAAEYQLTAMEAVLITLQDLMKEERG